MATAEDWKDSKHRWIRVKNDDPRSFDHPDHLGQYVMKCRRCGLIVEEVLPGVPNLHGAVEVDECDDVMVRSVLKS